MSENRVLQLGLELCGGVLTDEGWARSLDLVSEAFRGSSIFFGSLASGGTSAMTGHRVDEGCVALVGGPLATPAANPFIAPMMSKPVGKAYRTQEMCGDAALVRSELHDRALRPFGQRYAIGALLQRGGGELRSISFTRPAREGDYTEDDARLLDLLLPHISRAVHVRDALADARSRTTAALTALDAVHRGVIILSPDLSIVFANEEARRILSLGDGIDATASGLLFLDRTAAACIRNVFRSAARPNDAPIAEMTPIPIRRPSGLLPFILRVVPAPDFADSAYPRAALAITILDPERRSVPSTAIVRQIYGLTAVEARLAIALCELDLGHAAATLGISVNTAKTHLQAIFQKVGVSRQSALVRLITLHGAN